MGLEDAWGKVTCYMEELPQSQGAGVLTIDGSSQTRTAGHTTPSCWHFLG